jgi:hypothetical protein
MVNLKLTGKTNKQTNKHTHLYSLLNVSATSVQIWEHNSLFQLWEQACKNRLLCAMYINTHAGARTHTHTHTHTHTRKHTRRRAHKRTHTPTYTHTHNPTHTHTHLNTHTLINTPPTHTHTQNTSLKGQGRVMTSSLSMLGGVHVGRLHGQLAVITAGQYDPPAKSPRAGC